MEVSFEQLGQDLQAGRIVGYDTITDFGNPQFNMRREESIKPNKLMEFRYRDGSVKKAIVFQQGQDIFEPKVNFLTIQPEELQELRVVKTLNRLTPESARRYNLDINDYLNVSALFWASGTSFDDLQAMNILFLRGLLPFTPEHGGPIFEETHSILPQLIQMNKDGMITTDSQPFEESMATIYNPPIPYRQKPYVHFFMAKDKAERIVQSIRSRDPSASIVVHRLDTNEYRIIGNSEVVLDQEYRNGQWEDSDEMTLQRRPFDQEYAIGLYGDNFRPLLNTLTFLRIYSSEFNNNLFIYLNDHLD